MCGGRGDSGGRAEVAGQVEQGHPVVTDVRRVDRIIKPGGAPARFCVVLSNPTDRLYNNAELTFTFDPAGGPSGPTLEWLSGSGWQKLPLRWYDPDEPGELRSEPLLVDLEPGEVRIIDLRFRLPDEYSTDLADYGGSADIAGPSEGPNWGSRRLLERWRIDQPLPTVLKVTEPPIVTLGGVAAVYTVVVDNRRGRDEGSVRLVLKATNSDVRPLQFATIEARRNGTWRPVRQPAGRLSAPFAMPAGYRGVFTFRVTVDQRMGDAAVSEGGWFDAKVLLMHAHQPLTGPSLAEAHVETELETPTVSLEGDEDVVIGEPATFALTVENTTGVTYPPMHVLVDIGPYVKVDSITMAYQAPGKTTWTKLAFSPDRGSLVARLPGRGGIDGTDGARVRYALRLITKSSSPLQGSVTLVADTIDNPVYWDTFVGRPGPP